VSGLRDLGVGLALDQQRDHRVLGRREPSSEGYVWPRHPDRLTRKEAIAWRATGPAQGGVLLVASVGGGHD
jgi:hypothetical protein